MKVKANQLRALKNHRFCVVLEKPDPDKRTYPAGFEEVVIPMMSISTTGSTWNKTLKHMNPTKITIFTCYELELSGVYAEE